MPLILTDAQPRGLGYYEADNRATDLPPGTPRHFEADTYTCTHCQYVVVMNPQRVRERYKCKSCNHHICDPCAAEMAAGAACVPFVQKVEQHLEQALRQPEPGSILLP